MARLTLTKFAPASVIVMITFASHSSFILAGELTVDFWYLSTGVVESSTSQNNGEDTLTIQNPYIAVQHGSLPVGSATTSYDLSWNNSSGNFLIDLFHTLRDVPTHSAYVESAGTILFRSSQDLLIDLSAFYTYQGLGSEFISSMTLDVVDHGVSPVFHYLNYGQNGGPVFLSPPSGTFSTSLQTLLPADHLIRVSYTFRLETYAGSSSAVGTANGGLQFTLTAVPEPSTALLLALGFGALILRKRRARPRR